MLHVHDKTHEKILSLTEGFVLRGSSQVTPDFVSLTGDTNHPSVLSSLHFIIYFTIELGEGSFKFGF